MGKAYDQIDFILNTPQRDLFPVPTLEAIKLKLRNCLQKNKYTLDQAGAH